MPNCDHCGGLFYKPYEPKQRFCSLSCSLSDRNHRISQKRIAEYEAAPRSCSRCQTALPYKARNSTYCSRSCAASVNNINVCRNPKLERHNSNCTHCMKPFEYVPGSRTGFFCSHACFGDNKKTYTLALASQGLVATRRTLRAFVIERDGYQCKCCGISEWAGRRIGLQLDHTDGNPANNLPDNLRLLCPNCHSQTPTWGARNKGNGRKARGISLG